MIWHVAVELKEVFAPGRNYPWRRPEGCLQCGHFRVWGDGFVRRDFDGFDAAVLLRCYRCPGCGCAITARPAGYFRRLRSTVASIRDALSHRLNKGRWLSSPGCASRMRHWLANLRRQALAWLGWTGEHELLDAFDRLLEAGVVPVGRRIQSGNRDGCSKTP